MINKFIQPSRYLVYGFRNKTKELPKIQRFSFFNMMKNVKQNSAQALMSKQPQDGLRYINNLQRQSFSSSTQKLTHEQKIENINAVLNSIKIQDQSKPIKELVQSQNLDDSDNLSIVLSVDTNFSKIKARLTSQLRANLTWIGDIKVELAQKDQEKKFQKNKNLLGIKKIIAVSSCKGGVGKSTVSLNLAFALKNVGKKVGIFDADIYGPSLPTLVSKEKEELRGPSDSPKELLPVDFEGVATMSYGYATRERAVIRGPLVSQIVNSLLQQTRWGDLDYLIVDFPPGTGDIQITLCQEVKFNGAVIVTTPQKISFIDVVKGIEMFDDLKVPTISVVENMAGFECDECHASYTPFGMGYLDVLQNQFGIKSSLSIPIYKEISRYSDSGAPLPLVLPPFHPINLLYSKLAKSVLEELNFLESYQAPIVRYQTGTQEIIVQREKEILKKMKAFKLRVNCTCALCVDEFTGKKLIVEEKIDKDVYPIHINQKGNYAVSVIWSDGHKSSIYPYDNLLKIQ